MTTLSILVIVFFGISFVCTLFLFLNREHAIGDTMEEIVLVSLYVSVVCCLTLSFTLSLVVLCR